MSAIGGKADIVGKEIGDQAWLAALEHLLRDLAAGFEPVPGQRGPVAPAAHGIKDLSL